MSSVVMIYPEQTWYGNVASDDAEEMMDALEEGETAERLEILILFRYKASVLIMLSLQMISEYRGPSYFVYLGCFKKHDRKAG